MPDESLLDLIYEAAALPQQWPDVLQGLADHYGAKAATIFVADAGQTDWIASPSGQAMFQAYIDDGWMTDNARGAPLVADAHPWFVTDTDLRSEDEIARMPVYRDFFAPRGMSAGAGTVVKGARDDLVVLTVEGFPSHAVARAQLAGLDRLRPHLARAVSLAARIRLANTHASLAGFDAINAAAAVVSGRGTLRAANRAFIDRIGNRMIEGRQRLRFLDTILDRRFAQALEPAGRGPPALRSIPIWDDKDGRPVVMHLIPLRRASRDVFESDGMILLIAGAANASLPDANVLRLLFDLTPAEARLARALADGRAVPAIAQELGCSYRPPACISARSIPRPVSRGRQSWSACFSPTRSDGRRRPPASDGGRPLVARHRMRVLRSEAVADRDLQDGIELVVVDIVLKVEPLALQIGLERRVARR